MPPVSTGGSGREAGGHRLRRLPPDESAGGVAQGGAAEVEGGGGEVKGRSFPLQNYKSRRHYSS